MRVFWPSIISNGRLLHATGQKGMGTILLRRRLRWLGHVLRMEPTARTRSALIWTPKGGREKDAQEQHGGEQFNGRDEGALVLVGRGLQDYRLVQ